MRSQSEAVEKNKVKPPFSQNTRAKAGGVVQFIADSISDLSEDDDWVFMV
jgi:hypothetical protein